MIHRLYHTGMEKLLRTLIGKDFELLWGTEFTTALPSLMAWKSLWITHYTVPGELHPPEVKKARLRVTATPGYPVRENVFFFDREELPGMIRAGAARRFHLCRLHRNIQDKCYAATLMRAGSYTLPSIRLP